MPRRLLQSRRRASLPSIFKRFATSWENKEGIHNHRRRFGNWVNESIALNQRLLLLSNQNYPLTKLPTYPMSYLIPKSAVSFTVVNLCFSTTISSEWIIGYLASPA